MHRGETAKKIGKPTGSYFIKGYVNNTGYETFISISVGTMLDL